MDKRIIATLIVIILLVLGATLFIMNKNQERTSAPQASSARPNIHEVTLTDKGFSPSSLTIKRNETVMWINQSGKNASVNSNPHPTHNLHRFLNLGEFPKGSSVQAVFGTAGTFNYHNHLNPEQFGTIVVR